jgi:hypothetical protein
VGCHCWLAATLVSRETRVAMVLDTHGTPEQLSEDWRRQQVVGTVFVRLSVPGRAARLYLARHLPLVSLATIAYAPSLLTVSSQKMPRPRSLLPGRPAVPGKSDGGVAALHLMRALRSRECRLPGVLGSRPAWA